MNALYEILVPTQTNAGKPIRTRQHREWDNRVRKIAGGLTVLAPAKGQWVAPDLELFRERMIPVRIMCTAEQIEDIAFITAMFYDQKAVMFYKVSDEVRINHYDDGKKIAPVEPVEFFESAYPYRPKADV